MKSFDTNVAVRLVVEDDPTQCDRAAGAFRQAIATEGVFFSATVLVEVAWVLRVACKQDRASIAAALRRLVSTSGVTVEHDAIVRRRLRDRASRLLRLLHSRVVQRGERSSRGHLR